MLPLLCRAAVIIALALVTGLTINHVQIGALWRHVEVHLVENYAPLPVDLDFVQQWQQQGKLIVDARSQNNYADGHIVIIQGYQGSGNESLKLPSLYRLEVVFLG